MNLSDKALEIKKSETLNITARANQMREDGIDVISFAAGEPDFDTPDYIKQAAINAINDNFTRYTPSEGNVELKQAICDKLKKDNFLNYSNNQIVVSNGSKHALINTFIAILNFGDEVIIPAPYWLSYPEIVKIADGVPVIVNTDKEKCFKITVEQIEKNMTDKTKAIIINSPNNPTGMVYTIDELNKIADFAVKNDLYIVSDELYEKLIYSSKSKHISIASLNDEIYYRTIVINGLSKSHAMTGWRVGYSASNKEIAQVIANIQSQCTANVNSIAQKAALAALTGEQDCIKDMVKAFERRRDYISQRISDIPLLSSLRPKGAFYLFVDISKLCGNAVNNEVINNAEDVAKILLEKYNVAVIPWDSFGYDEYIRISYAASMGDIVEGLNRIERFVKDNF